MELKLDSKLGLRKSSVESPAEPIISIGSVIELTGHNMHGKEADGGGTTGYDKKD